MAQQGNKIFKSSTSQLNFAFICYNEGKTWRRERRYTHRATRKILIRTEMEVNFLNNVFALGYHHHGHWSPLIRIPIILNRRTNEKLSIIYSVTGSEHKTKKASMVSCHKRLRQLCFYPSFFTAFPQTGDLFLLCLGLSHTKKHFLAKKLEKTALCSC